MNSIPSRQIVLTAGAPRSGILLLVQTLVVFGAPVVVERCPIPDLDEHDSPIGNALVLANYVNTLIVDYELAQALL